jgi:hypothetical protein
MKVPARAKGTGAERYTQVNRIGTYRVCDLQEEVRLLKWGG